MFRSATLKLTLYYTAIIMAISAVFSVVIYHYGTQELERGLQHQFTRFSREYSSFPSLGPPPGFDNDLGQGDHRLLMRLISFNIVVLLGAAASSYILARRTLLPIEAAHEQQKRFTADVSHELRTPLTALKMESEVALLDTKANAGSLRTTLSSNLEEANKLEALINNLLRLSKLEAGDIRQTFTPVDMKQVVDEAVEKVSKAAAQHKLALTSDISSVKVSGDHTSLVQLVTILLDNAVKYSAGDAKLDLTLKRRGNEAVLTLKDNGRGIDPKILPHVFDRFYRADNSRSNQTVEGFGLGLPLAKTIADLHHGTVQLASAVGKGTTATVTIPTI